MTSIGPNPSDIPSGDGTKDRTDTGDPYRNLAGAAAEMLEAYARIMAGVAGGMTGAQDASGKARQKEAVGLPAALIDASSIASGSALRYGQRLSEVIARHQAVLMTAATARLPAEGPTPEQKVADAEAFRHFLREVSETALHEARRLEQELERLGEAVAQGADLSAKTDTHDRYWNVKL